MPTPLPIDPLLPRVVDALRTGSRLVLRAAPGAGKTTRVPAALLDAGADGGKQVVVLEPRRIAPRAAAEFVARRRGGSVGEEVGYRARFEQRGGARTRLWFVTEGVFSRSLVRDPYLEGVGVVVLDEFHERHLQGGVVRELQETVRPDLNLAVMSATLDTERLAAYLGGSPALTSEGRAFPVTIEHEREPSGARPDARVAAAVSRVLGDPGDRGDVLVFLPGAAAIRRAAQAAAPLAAAHGLDVVPLHGDLPLDAQRRAIEPGRRRRVVLSTNVAETALTIEGVTAVIDRGLAREARFDPGRGLNRLEEVRVSRAAAEQRAGRAGRTRPGRCLRLWTAAEHAERRERELPEVLRLDLAAIALELRAWGARDLARFPWLDSPSEAALRSAERLLRELGTVDEGGEVTDVGRRMLAIAAAPHLACILVEAERRGAADAPLVAALATERDILLERRELGAERPATGARWATGRSDLLLRLELFREAERAGFSAAACSSLGLDPAALRAVERARRQLARTAPAGPGSPGAGAGDALLRCALAGFPDRVVRRRERGWPRGVMVGGTGVVLDPASVVREAELFVAVDLDAGPRRERSEARVRIASAVEREWLEEAFPQAVRREREIVFETAAERVVERERERYQDLVLGEVVRHDVDRRLAGERIAVAAKRDPAAALALGADEERLLDRARFLARTMPELGFPESSDVLLHRVIDALAPDKRSFAELRYRRRPLPGRFGLGSRREGVSASSPLPPLPPVRTPAPRSRGPEPNESRKCRRAAPPVRASPRAPGWRRQRLARRRPRRRSRPRRRESPSRRRRAAGEARARPAAPRRAGRRW
ncbi:MAG: ATP-dependent helicase HrpB [Deltaproteobacteria bacterium]|nr:ATP-dependent helicase HrpB [Deltaproteobacteria bacterium]